MPLMRLTVNGRFLLQDVTGVQKVAIEFVKALDALLADGAYPGLAVELVAPARGELVTEPLLKTIRLRRAGRLSGQAWEQLELPGLVGRGPLLCLGNLAPLALLLNKRAPVYTMVHDLSYKYFPSAYSRSFRAVYNTVIPAVLARSEQVFTVSVSEATAISRHYGRLIGPERLVAVQNGGGEGASSARPGDGSKSLEPGAPDVPSREVRQRRCLYVGSLTRRKNAEGLARAAMQLVREDDMELVVVGATGSSFEQTGLEIPSELAGRIHFRGQINDPGLIEAEYRRAGVFVFPSFYEASPLPPVEAMRFGCPVVAADIPSLRERCGDAALYCDPEDPGSIVCQVRRVMGDAEVWEGLQRRGLERAAGFSWRSQVEAVLDHVEGVRELRAGAD
jgi:glycosyltransferase involved in cell wall biosynthesis